MLELGILIVCLFGWSINRPLNDEHRTALKLASKGNSKKESMVKELLAKNNAKSWESARLLHKFNMMKFSEK
jgi:hypothetical protein